MADATLTAVAEPPFLPEQLVSGATQTASPINDTDSGGSTPQIRDRVVFTCGGCRARWTTLRQAHCSGCCRTFTTVGNFDRHRRDGQCRHPSTVGLVQRPDGLWSAPAPDPTQRDMAWRNR